MRRTNQSVYWAVFLLLAGILLLFRNLGTLGPWAEPAWGGLFALTGLGFLLWYVFDLKQWWRLISGFVLVSIGALVLLPWRGIALGDWAASLVMFGIALGFWAILLMSGENWWAVLPAGVLTTLGVLTGLRNSIKEELWLTAFFLGLGAVFVLLHLVRSRRGDGWSAAVPAAALMLFGLATFGETQPLGALARWWPILLSLLGVLVLAFSVPRAGPTPVRPTIPAGVETIRPAAGTSITEKIPDVDIPSTAGRPKALPASASELAPDIYEVLKQQPTDPQGDAPASSAPDDAGSI